MAVEPAAEEQFGPYVVYERLGVGGMATVHRALERHEDGFERMVALKRLLPHLAEDASFIKSFVREAKLASLLNHVNIVQIYELGRVGTEYFITMEYIDGRDIRQILRHARKVSGPPPIHITVGLVLQLAEALDYAHSKVDEEGQPLKLVHRDVSPSNLLVTNAGHLKVIDFGIAKAESSQLRTQTGRVKGKLAYMAPEAVAGGKDLDARSDIWAAGVILHELLCARPLFASKNEYQTLLKVQRGDIMPPSTFNQGSPPELDAIVLKALARDPDERFMRAGEMRDELLAVKKQYALQTGYRDIATWVEWAFSLEQPPSFQTTGSDNDGVSAVGSAPQPPQPVQKRPKTPRPARDKEEDEAVEMVWGSGEGESVSGPLVLDDVPDVSERHAALRADTELAEYDDIPTPMPTHGARPVHRHAVDIELSTDPGLPPLNLDPALARGTDPPKPRGSSNVVAQRGTGGYPTAKRTTAPGIAIPRFPTPPAGIPHRVSNNFGATDPDATPLPEPLELVPPTDPGSADLTLDTDPVGKLTLDSDPLGLSLTNPLAKPLTEESLFGNDHHSDNEETLPPFPDDDAAPTMAEMRRQRGSAAPSQPPISHAPTITTPPPGALPPVPVVRFSKSHTVPPSSGLADSNRPPPTTRQGIGPAAARPGIASEVASAAAGAAMTITASRKKAPSRAMVGASMIERRSGGKMWIAVAIALVVAAGGAAAVFFATRGDVDEPPIAPAKVTPPSEAQPVAPAKSTSTVKFVIEPTDCEIKIEGMDTHTGSPWSTELAPGIHQIEIHHSGYKAWLTSLELSAGENETLHVVLERLGTATDADAASLAIATTPSGLDVLVDGKPLAEKTPVKITVKAGPHAIAVRQNGVDVWHQTLKAEANSDYEFHPNVTAEKQRERAASDSPAPRPASKPAPPKPPTPATPGSDKSDKTDKSDGSAKTDVDQPEANPYENAPKVEPKAEPAAPPPAATPPSTPAASAAGSATAAPR